MILHVFVVDIFEGETSDDYPVVSHSFYGRTRAEAKGYFEAHKKTDEFLRACLETGRWNGVECWTESYWDEELIEGDDEDDEEPEEDDD